MRCLSHDSWSCQARGGQLLSAEVTPEIREEGLVGELLDKLGDGALGGRLLMKKGHHWGLGGGFLDCQLLVNNLGSFNRRASYDS